METCGSSGSGILARVQFRLADVNLLEVGAILDPKTRPGPWSTVLKIALPPLGLITIAMALAPPILSSTGFWIMITVFTFVAALVVIQSQIRPNTSGMAAIRMRGFPGIESWITVSLKETGVQFDVEGKSSTTEWQDCTQVRIDRSIVRFATKTRPAAVFIPCSAFATADELHYFVAVGQALIDSSRTGLPIVMPEHPDVWPPPPRELGQD